ncbi:hypothetical protein QE152_g36203 [Popillia japonica]|uniref:Retroviral polymerase SH3-like domain-containing protein n=1 Tax=Popillia japonica TaxID=7064 RepID=A0AAW1IDK7_POPJA
MGPELSSGVKINGDMIKSKLLDGNYSESAESALYSRNKNGSSKKGDNTPEGIWVGSKVDLSNIRIFGSSVMVNVPKPRRQKWDRKARKMVFVGYSDSTKGYRCLDPTTNEVITSRDVIFLETKPANVEEIEDVQSILTDSLSNEENNENEEDPNDASNGSKRCIQRTRADGDAAN